MIHLDTHVVVWLYAKELERFPRPGLQILEAGDLTISPIVMLELEYLYETRRITAKSGVIFDSLKETIGIGVSDASFADVVRESLAQTWTRDPFDRIIVAQARLADAVLLTKDRVMLKNYKRAFWGGEQQASAVSHK